MNDCVHRGYSERLFANLQPLSALHVTLLYLLNAQASCRSRYIRYCVFVYELSWCPCLFNLRSPRILCLFINPYHSSISSDDGWTYHWMAIHSRPRECWTICCFSLFIQNGSCIRATIDTQSDRNDNESPEMKTKNVKKVREFIIWNCYSKSLPSTNALNEIVPNRTKQKWSWAIQLEKKMIL